MNQREKLLLVGLLSVLGVILFVQVLWPAFYGPIDSEQKRLEAVLKVLDDQQLDVRLGQAKIARMSDYKERSLSSNASQGALAYQQWLSDLAEIVAKFGKPQVTPERITPSRDNSYVMVRIKVTGEGTLDQLREFLYRFRRANVLHQVSQLNVEALDSSLQPRLNVTMTAEALSLRDAEAKGPTLFPRTELLEDLKPEVNEIRVAQAKDFQVKVPFEIRIGDQYVTVTKATNNLWTIARPASQKFEAAAGSVVELSPVHPDFVNKTLADFEDVFRLNPFAKPVPYRPRMDLIGEKTIVRGAETKLELKATGFDTRSGAPKFEATGELPAGMTLTSDKLAWTPPADLKPGPYKVSFKATAKGLKEPLTATFDLTLKDANSPPKLDPPPGLVATIGKPFTVKLSATDADTPADQLKYKLADPKPEGALINETTGELTWTPAASVTVGETKIMVAVADAGTPPQTATVAIPVNVQDDTAQFTFLTASVAADDDRQAWLYDRSSNRRVILKEGKPLKYAGFDATVTSIGRDFVLLQQKEQTWKLEVGQNLSQAKTIEPEKCSETSSEKPASSDKSAETPSADSRASNGAAKSEEAPPLPESKPDASDDLR